MTIRALVAISDIHAGSTKAILPPDFVTLEGQPIGQSTFQKWLWGSWTDLNEWIAQRLEPMEYGLILNGDMIEGNHHRTTEIWSPEVGDHIKAAVEILEMPAARAAKTFMVRGTECHVGSGEIGIAKAIGAEVNPEVNQPYWDRLTLDMCGVRISVRHHFPATGRVHLEASQHSIQLNNAILEAVRNGEKPPQIIMGAHRHRPGHWSDGRHMSIVTGAWQGLTRHGFKVVPDGRPCPRAYLLDWRNREDGEMPEVEYLDFTAPEEGAVSL